MSLQSAEDFIIDCYQNLNEDLQNIMKNVNSNFESDYTKFHYISEKAKEYGYNFTSKEISDAFKGAKNKIGKSNILKTTTNFNIDDAAREAMKNFGVPHNDF